MNENEIKQLKNENKILQDKLDTERNARKKQAVELGQIIFKNEDLESEIRKLQKENEKLKKENEELLKFKQEVESSKSWKLKSMLK